MLEEYLGDMWRTFGGHLAGCWGNMVGHVEGIKRRLQVNNLVVGTLCVHILIKTNNKPCKITKEAQGKSNKPGTCQESHGLASSYRMLYTCSYHTSAP